MSSTPNRRLHEDGGNGSGSGSGSGNQCIPSGLKHAQDDQGTYSGIGGKVATSARHDYHAPYDTVQDGRMPKVAPRTESRDADRRSSLPPNVMFRVSTSNDPHSDYVGSDSRRELRESKDNNKEIKAETRDMKSESREMKSESREFNQIAKYDKHDSRAGDGRDLKHEKDAYSEFKGNEKMDKDQLNWKDMKELHRVKQYLDNPGGNAETWHTSRTSLHGAADAAKEGLHIETREFAEVREAVGENKVDMKGDDKSKDKDRKRKEVKHWEWAERDKERSDRWENLQTSNISNENREVAREGRDSERWGNEKKESLLQEKEKLIEKDVENAKRDLWSGSDKEALQSGKELADIPGKSVEQENSTLEPKKRDLDNWKGGEGDTRDRKKERDTELEPDRPEKRSKHHEKELDEGGMHAEGGLERERETFNGGVTQRKRMLRSRGSPQVGNRDQRIRPCANDNEGSQEESLMNERNNTNGISDPQVLVNSGVVGAGKADVSCVYKVGECMQELVKLWKEYESSQADKACERSQSSQNGPTLEIRIPAEYVTATNRQVRSGQLWGTDVYTVDSDLVAVLMHTGYCRPTSSPPPSATQELWATIRVLPPQDCYISTLRNSVRSRAWGAVIGCSYRVERCCIVKKGGGIIELEPCLTHSSIIEPTLAPVAVERTMTTRAAASNALRQQRFVREVTIQFNRCMEPWLKYTISAVADKGLKKSLFTSARLKKGEVLYLETHSHRYELCFNGEKLMKAATAPTANGSETGKTPTYTTHVINGERNAVDADSFVDTFRWSRCKRALPQKFMQSIGIPLPLEHLEVLEENLEWEDITWSQTGVWIAGREYHLARAHFLSPS